ncbi:MAG: Kae1-associated serine/threonine protein kinase [Methanomassiliicoccaceae archaeon]|jgi:TP53 regulating kinase-like protein/N6-L-threonylcarbamoyladenine synthase/protein kinase Bud32|nr:Kae1-associated serine/threonine protein kinase [Methanomassiliicoccaceae archaeon]
MRERDILGCGAEATVYRTKYLGREAVVKTRTPKSYRHSELDMRLRSSRTKNEARIMIEARKLGVRTPVIYDIDVNACNITMEFVTGRKVKDVLDEEPSGAKELCGKIGKIIAELHNGRISHGDLTTSNMILMPDGEICLLDMSLGTTLAEIEDLGVDVHLLQRAFTSAHSGLDDCITDIMSSYAEHMKDAGNVLRRVDDIRNRGRYT